MVEVRYDWADLVAKNMTLTADEAWAFWPLYKQYEAATRVLNDERFELLKKYVDAGDKADPAVVASWLKASLKRDLNMAKLRIDWAPKFEKVLPKSKAIDSSRSTACLRCWPMRTRPTSSPSPRTSSRFAPSR